MASDDFRKLGSSSTKMVHIRGFVVAAVVVVVVVCQSVRLVGWLSRG